MNKLANMRHWSGQGFGISRPNMTMTPIPQQPPPHTKAPPGVSPVPSTGPDAIIHYSFNVPFSSDLAGPNTEDIVYATTDAVLRWTHPEDAPDDVPVYELPIHAANVADLRLYCQDINGSGMPIEAFVKVSEPKRIKGQVTNVCLTGNPDLVHKSREKILGEMPLAMRCTFVDVEDGLLIDLGAAEFKGAVLRQLEDFHIFCGVDIFILGPKIESSLLAGGDVGQDRRFRIAIYGDMESTEHAKTRVLTMIDRLLGRQVDASFLELSLHPLVCGRNRKNIKQIESLTNTAIYFPSPFTSLFKYVPRGASRRNPEEIYITGETVQDIVMAKQKLHELVTRLQLFVKDAIVAPAKLDSILLTRLDKVRKIMESNGTFIHFPALAAQRNVIRVQGYDVLHCERTIKDLMGLTGQFYSASWWIQQPNTPQTPSAADIRIMLSDICANSDADVSFDKLTYNITGSDDAVRFALMVIAQVRFVMRSTYQIRVKIELANEHKEFVSGKKNGKINKIMGQSNVQIIFDGFNEYNFNIEVCGTSYDAMKSGLSLVEQEMPASISFHVPDQYHKRIIGIGGQHIQRIMKKHSVFVKFSNAMDRGGIGRDDDDIKVDNVICRTPARNATALELVKGEILEMVDQVDKAFTSQTVTVDRLYHRELIAHMPQLEELEKKWNCKINFPSTEEASDDVTISGPEWQVPECVDGFLGMVPDSHELVLKDSDKLTTFVRSEPFLQGLVPILQRQYEVKVEVKPNQDMTEEVDGPTMKFLWSFTRNNAGGIRDAIEFFMSQLAIAGVETSIVRGSIARPKSDSYEESAPFFGSSILPPIGSSATTDSPTRTSFGEDATTSRSSIFDKLRKPSSMASLGSFLDRRKNSQSPGSIFKNGSSNVSKASLISIESTRSFNADRNPWNDSGVSVNLDEPMWPGHQFVNGVNDAKMSFNNSHSQHPGDATPKHIMRASTDSGRPSTSNSTNSGYPGHMGPPR